MEHYCASLFHTHLSQAIISRAVLLDTPIPLPPLTEQQRIVAKVQALLARVNAARQRLAKMPAILKRFRQSVLAAACSGRLTVDWRETNADAASGVHLVDAIRRAKKSTPTLTFRTTFP